MVNVARKRGKPGVTSSDGPKDLSIGPKWVFTTGAAVLSSPGLDNGQLYINSGDRYVYCLNAYTGEEIWKFLTNEPKMTTFGSTPAVIGDKVIIGPDDGTIYCLSTSTGTKLWSIDAGPYRAVKVAHGQLNTFFADKLPQQEIRWLMSRQHFHCID
jgi:outer membrane protein assembly factor BamB